MTHRYNGLPYLTPELLQRGDIFKSLGILLNLLNLRQKNKMHLENLTSQIKWKPFFQMEFRKLLEIRELNSLNITVY